MSVRQAFSDIQPDCRRSLSAAEFATCKNLGKLVFLAASPCLLSAEDPALDAFLTFTVVETTLLSGDTHVTSNDLHNSQVEWRAEIEALLFSVASSAASIRDRRSILKLMAMVVGYRFAAIYRKFRRCSQVGLELWEYLKASNSGLLFSLGFGSGMEAAFQEEMTSRRIEDERRERMSRARERLTAYISSQSQSRGHANLSFSTSGPLDQSSGLPAQEIQTDQTPYSPTGSHSVGDNPLEMAMNSQGAALTGPHPSSVATHTTDHDRRARQLGTVHSISPYEVSRFDLVPSAFDLELLMANLGFHISPERNPAEEEESETLVGEASAATYPSISS